VSQTESQLAADLSFQESLKKFHNLNNEARINAERIDGARLASLISVLEHYTNGRLSLLFDVPTWREFYVMGKGIGSSHSESTFFLPHLVFNLNIVGAAVMDHWSQEPVLVSPVHIVNGPDGEVPSVVRLYIAENEVEQPFTGDIYFVPLKRSFKAMQCGMNRKLDMLGIARGDKLLDRLNPNIVEGALKIMDGIPDHYRDILGDGSILQIILDEFVASLRVYLSRDQYSVFQTSESLLHLGDMLIGPFDFEPGVVE
jgi:hypothetical protein